MKALRIAIVCALVLCAVGARAEEETDERTYGLEGLETVEPVFIEDAATTEVGGFPIPLTDKQKKTTMEPQYLGEKKVKAWISPEYAVPKPKDPKKKKKGPVVFTSHYFSPMPKPPKGVRFPPRKGEKPKKRRRVPLKSVETPTGLAMRNGYIVPEIMTKLPNKIEPKDRSKITLAPAPVATLVELGATLEEANEAVAGAAVDTSAEAQAETESEEANPPPFSAEENQHIPTIISGPHEFFQDGFQTPDWADEAVGDEVSTGEEETESEQTEEGSEEEEVAEPALIEAAADTETEEEFEFEDEEEEAEADEEEEAEDEADEEEEEADEEEFLDEEDEEEQTDAVEGEEEEEADEEEEEGEAEGEEEEADEEAEETEQVEEPALIESAAVVTDSEDAELDEVEANEIAAQQIDMDATHDDVGSEEEEEEGEEADESEQEEEADESFDEAVAEDSEETEEADEMSANEAAAELVETDALDTSVDTLLAEIDAHLAAEEQSASNTETDTESEAQTESDSESEAEADTESKGTPGHAISAGMTWEQAQEAREAEEQAQLAAEKAAAPKVAATVVTSADLHSADAGTQTPEFDSEEVHVETVAPQLVDTLPAQAALMEKIAKLKALRKQ